MNDSFISFRILDAIDILLVAFLLYQVYMIIKGTVAINIFVGIFSVYLLWLIVKALNMELLSSILGQFIGVGVIALIIVFQQELRRFLLLIGSRYFVKTKKFSLERLLSINIKTSFEGSISPVVSACVNMSKTKTGALIVVSKRLELSPIANTGDELNAIVSSRLLESIFYKNSPLHDGAALIQGNKIKAARCVLPISDNQNIPASLGLRHKAALGLTETANVLVVIVSEQTGNISFAKDGILNVNVSKEELEEVLKEELL